MNHEKSGLSEDEEKIAKAIVNAAFKIHNEFGPGLLEKIYEACLVHQLRQMGFSVERQASIPIQFDGVVFEEGLRLDILVDKKVVIEMKAMDQVNPVWVAQVLSHLTLTDLQLGFIINFHVPLIKNGIRRIIRHRG